MSKELLEAAKKGNLETLKYLLNKGADKQTRDESGSTILFIAIRAGHLEIVKYLLENQIFKHNETDTQNNKILTAAIQEGQVAIVEYLMYFDPERIFAQYHYKNRDGQDAWGYVLDYEKNDPSKATLIKNAINSFKLFYSIDELLRSDLYNDARTRTLIIRNANGKTSQLIELAKALQKTKVEILQIQDSAGLFIDGDTLVAFSKFISLLGDTSVHTLSLPGNQLGARLYQDPALAFADLHKTRIKNLDLSNNHFEGFIPSYVGRSDGCMMNGRWNTGEAYLDYQGEPKLRNFGRALRCLNTLNLSDQSLTPRFQHFKNNSAFKALTHFASGLEGGSLKTIIMNNHCFYMHKCISDDMERVIFIEFIEALRKINSLTCIKATNNILCSDRDYADYSTNLNPSVILELKKLCNLFENQELEFEFDFGDRVNQVIYNILKNKYTPHNMKVMRLDQNHEELKLQQEFNFLSVRNNTLAYIASAFAECTPLVRNSIKVILDYYDLDISACYSSPSFVSHYEAYKLLPKPSLRCLTLQKDPVSEGNSQSNSSIEKTVENVNNKTLSSSSSNDTKSVQESPEKEAGKDNQKEPTPSVEGHAKYRSRYSRKK